MSFRLQRIMGRTLQTSTLPKRPEAGSRGAGAGSGLDQPGADGIAREVEAVELVLLGLTIAVGALTVVAGRATVLQGTAHVATFGGFRFLAVVA